MICNLNIAKIVVAIALLSAVNFDAAYAQVGAETDYGPDIEAADALATSLHARDAEAAYRQILANRPNDPTIHVRYAAFKRFMGDYGEAVRLLQRAEQLVIDGGVLVGGNNQIPLSYGITYYRNGVNYDDAAAIFRGMVGANPGVPTSHSHLAFSELGRGNFGVALREFQVAEHLFGERLNSYRAAELILGYAFVGSREDVLRMFSRMQAMTEVSQAAWAAAHVALGNYPEAITRLEAAIDNPETIPGAFQVLSLLSSKAFGDPALAGPQFQQLFGRMRGN